MTVARDVGAERSGPWQVLKNAAQEAESERLGASTAPELQLRALFAHAAELEAVGLSNNLRINYCTALPHNLRLTHRYRGNARFVIVVVCDPDREDGRARPRHRDRHLADAGTVPWARIARRLWDHPGGVTPGQAPAGGVTPAGVVDDDKHILAETITSSTTHTLAERMRYVPFNGGFHCSSKDSRIGARAKAFAQVGGHSETFHPQPRHRLVEPILKLLAGSAPNLRFPALGLPSASDCEHMNSYSWQISWRSSCGATTTGSCTSRPPAKTQECGGWWGGRGEREEERGRGT